VLYADLSKSRATRSRTIELHFAPRALAQALPAAASIDPGDIRSTVIILLPLTPRRANRAKKSAACFRRLSG
jgi:hypothetical protein